jgi:hypothetical protein
LGGEWDRGKGVAKPGPRPDSLVGQDVAVIALVVLGLLLGGVVAGAMYSRQGMDRTLEDLRDLEGRVVEVSSGSISRGLAEIASVEGTLVQVDAQYLVLEPKFEQVSPRFEPMRQNDRSLKIPVYEVIDVTYAGSVIRLR